MDTPSRPRRRSQSTPGFYRRVYKSADTASTTFRDEYNARTIPVRIAYDGPKFFLRWTETVQNLKFDFLLPVFAEGLLETAWPYTFVAQAGINDLIHFTTTERISDIIPALVPPLARATATGDVRTLAAMEFLRNLVELHSSIAVKLVPHYSRLFGPLRPFYMSTGTTVPLYERYGRYAANQSIDGYLQYIVQRAGPLGRKAIKAVLPTFC